MICPRCMGHKLYWYLTADIAAVPEALHRNGRYVVAVHFFSADIRVSVLRLKITVWLNVLWRRGLSVLWLVRIGQAWGCCNLICTWLPEKHGGYLMPCIMNWCYNFAQSILQISTLCGNKYYILLFLDRYLLQFAIMPVSRVSFSFYLWIRFHYYANLNIY